MYEVETHIKPEHIDCQGILDGLYYPFYMEEVRHKFMRECHNIDLEEAAKLGNLYVLVSYELRFKQPLKGNDLVKVTCELKPISALKFGFHQKMVSNGKVCAEADFVCTCIPASGGRPFLPAELKEALRSL